LLYGHSGCDVALSHADPLRAHNWKSMKPLEDPEGSLPFIKEILGSLRQEIDSETTLLGFVGSPWTLTAYSVEGKAERHCKATKVRSLVHSVLLAGFELTFCTAGSV
jgi:uroporphyrinogen-III decarboxylase